MSMNEEQFTELALKAASGEADAAERALLAEALRGDLTLARAREFEALREAFLVAREAAPLSEALAPQGIAFPEHRLRELRASVREAFPRQEEKPRFSLFRFFASSPAWAGAAFASLAVCLALPALLPAPKPYVAVGMYAEEATRGEAGGNSAIPGAAVRRFDSDAAFAAWRSSSFAKGEKARIWIDEEHDLVHIDYPGASEKTEPLPAAPADREAQLRRLAFGITGR